MRRNEKCWRLLVIRLSEVIKQKLNITKNIGYLLKTDSVFQCFFSFMATLHCVVKTPSTNSFVYRHIIAYLKTQNIKMSLNILLIIYYFSSNLYFSLLFKLENNEMPFYYTFLLFYKHFLAGSLVS
jgi:hypothetical protein